MANQAVLPLTAEITAQPQHGLRRAQAFVGPVLLSLVVTGVLYASRTQDVGVLDVSLAFLLNCIAFVLYRAWTENNKTPAKWSAAPLLLTIAVASAQYFGAGIFWSSRTQGNLDRGPYLLPHAICTTALVLSLLFVAAVYYGTQLRVADSLCSTHLPYLRSDATAWNYCRLVLAVGIATVHTLDSAMAMEGFRGVFINAMAIVPLAAFCIIFRRYLQGEASWTDKALLVLFAANRAFTGIASGWLGSVVEFAVVLIVIYVSVRKRLPLTALAIVLGYVIFMQPGKTKFREEFWYGGREASAIERVNFWVGTSAQAWGDILSNRATNTDASNILSQTADRTSLISTTAQVVEQVPSTIPYQNGGTYGFLLISWVPRFLWPDKPSASEVNHLYQVTFRITHEKDLESVSLAPGIIGEAYWNFGWAGVVMMSLLLGIFLRFLELQCARQNSGIFMNTLIVITIPQFLAIGAHMGTYVGGLLLQVLVLLAGFAPVLVFRSRSAAPPA